MASQEENSFYGQQPLRVHTFSVLRLAQDEIDVRFGWIAEDLELDKLERGVMELPPRPDRLLKVGNVVLSALSAVAQSMPRLYR